MTKHHKYPTLTWEQRQTRFWEKVDKRGPDDCWEWQAYVDKKGYGGFGLGPSNKEAAHRVSFLICYGYLPVGLVLDHLCRNTLCVNPKHLEAVTIKENVLRGVSPWALNAKKTHCVHGHLFDKENTYIDPQQKGRHCRTCRRENNERSSRKKLNV